ncbi:ABC transporter permease [Rhizomonospora bruguierae]|uniref:ABC transporter permease n=1 Tax=Rhizomonospora bruguierae TaxID=1581705 RepID=UPI001BCB7F83|nr:ABC transporter permease subunit [Micromonospora sp. NBRC 107566]
MNTTVAWITARGLFGRRRFLLLFPLPVILVGLAAIARYAGVSAVQWATPVIEGLGLSVLIPITALIVGTGVLGSEIDDGTIVHILTKPLPRSQIILAKLAVAVGVTTVAVAVPLYLAGALTGSVRLGLSLIVGAAVGSLVYTAIFLLLSLVTRRPVLLGLLYVLVWEGLLSNLVSGTRVLSVQQYTLSITDAVARSELLTGRVSLTVALIMSAVLTVVSTVLAIDRLRSFSVAGETS